MQLHLPQTVEVKGQRVLLTRQLAKAYGTERQIISNNYTRNKKRYIEGKHVIILEGEFLKDFKASHQIDDNLKYAHTLYLWTEKGALLHAKSLNTDKAWEVYDYLVDFYFRAKEEKAEKQIERRLVRNPMMIDVVDVPDNPKILAAIRKIRNDLTAMDVLMEELIRYHSEESYKEKVRAATGIIHILVGDSTKLLHMKPQLVQKEY